MNYVTVFALLAVLAFLAHRCTAGSEKQLIASAAQNGHELAVYEHSSTLGIGVKGYSAHLLFDKKEVDHWHHSWPIMPESYPDWVVKTFSEATDSWTVYVSPAKFSRSDFDDMIACYEASKVAMDAAMKAEFTLYDTERFQVIGRFIYGERPVPLIFKPTAQRYQAFTGFGFTEKAVLTQEEIVVQPDGKWEHLRTQTEGGHSQGGASLFGEITRENGRLYFTPPPDSNWHEMPGSIRPDAVSRLDYLHSFTDSQGRRLDEIFPWKTQ